MGDTDPIIPEITHGCKKFKFEIFRDQYIMK